MICDCDFSPIVLVEESKIENESGPAQCYRCGENFDSFSLAKEHMSEKHKIARKAHYGKPRSHQCHVCKAMFNNEDNLNNHVCNYSTAEIEEWGKNYCKVCDMNFARSDLLFSHNLTFHVTEKKFACDLCDFKVRIILLFSRILDFIQSNRLGFHL